MKKPNFSELKVMEKEHFHILPESLRWDSFADGFIYVDIAAGGVFLLKLSSSGRASVNRLEIFDGLESVSSINPLGLGSYIGTSFNAVFIYESQLGLTLSESLLGENQRFNDSFVDLEGNFIFGTKSQGARPKGQEEVFCLSPSDGLSILARDFSLANGIAHGGGFRNLLISDSQNHAIRVFVKGRSGFEARGDYASGFNGEPDGLLGLRDGSILCPIWGEGVVSLISDSGQVRTEIDTGRKYPTSAAISAGVEGKRWLAVSYAAEAGEPGGILTAETDLEPAPTRRVSTRDEHVSYLRDMLTQVRGLNV